MTSNYQLHQTAFEEAKKNGQKFVQEKGLLNSTLLSWTPEQVDSFIKVMLTAYDIRMRWDEG